MAGLPPPAQGLGGLPPRPPLSVVPGGQPAGLPPSGMMMPPPPGSGMMPPPAGAPPGGAPIGPNSPFTGMLTNLPAHVGPGWQALDIACRAMKVALRSVEFQKLPSVVAVVQSTLNVLQKLVTAYTSGEPGDLSTSTTKVTPPDSTAAPQADADSQPAPTEGEE